MTCNPCNNPCNKGCKPARYSKSFNLGNCDCEETDTKLSLNVSGGTLNYAAEKHTDIITGAQLGSIINFNDLRDVNIDYDFDAMCGEMIYHKYGECGDGCRSLEDAWNLFSIDSDGALQNQIKYVRGANAYGCPVFLDVPTNENQYWYAGWRPNGQFGYYQNTPVTTLPKDSNGNTLVVSQDPTTKQPIIGPLDINSFLDVHECTEFEAAPGFMIAGEGNSFCYYPNRKVAVAVLDLLVTAPLAAQVYADKWVATIKNPKFWPAIGDAGFSDLPLHWVYQNNTDGKIMPIALRIDNQGRLLLTGEVTARPLSGKAAYMVLGVDDTISWDWKG